MTNKKLEKKLIYVFFSSLFKQTKQI